MPINKPYTTNIDGWSVRIKPPSSSQPQEDQHLLLMLHGWTGDENSMWFFANVLPQYYWLLAPRGIYSSDKGGFSWRPVISGKFADIRDFQDSVEKLTRLIDRLKNQFELSSDPIDIIGFSQGAALALSFLILRPEMIRKVACLSGFLPESAANYIQDGTLNGKQILITHGTEDDIIPIERGRRTAEILRPSGAEISYCEDKIGHKVSPPCLKSVEQFFK